MSPEQQAEIETCVAGSLTGAMRFPEVVARLTAIGVERYHADYSRHEATYYLTSGDSHCVPVAHPQQTIASRFSAAAVEAAIRQSQQGAISYPEFVALTMAAGCVGYFVQITGRCAMYFGRDGEQHREPFPVAK